MSESVDEKPTTSTGREKHELRTSDASALFDLKGELYRKKLEQRRNAEARLTQTAPKRNVLLITKEEERRRQEESSKRQKRIKDLEKGIREEEEARQRAQKILEEKAAIYNRLSKGEALVNEDGQAVEFLVDFDAKKREEAEQRNEERKREEEEAAQNEAVHFVSGEDQRTYGVSHVAFSVSEAKRQQQMQDLLELSKKTEMEREKRKKILEMRRRANLERLNKVRVRKGLEPLPLTDEPNKDEEEMGPFLDIPMPSGPEPNKQPQPEAKVDKKPQFGIREWDRGKVAYMRWIDGQREERNEEFRPPASYFR
ncbi:Coiled-coil domain-containing protein [Toxocara canis]|uniref:Coiled-coil domain-containing protein n=1 Tax=Toxocara canis TaxID=6265 RepID=A0A0B2VWB6_TOXCA|nr:Coiled-coil domain-containing protein [Toxocara canis]